MQLQRCIISVPFDCSSSVERSLCWLEMKILLDSGDLGLFFKPFFPSPTWHSNALYLRNLLLGRFHRWSEIAPSQLEWQRALISLLFGCAESRMAVFQGSFCSAFYPFRVLQGFRLIRHPCLEVHEECPAVVAVRPKRSKKKKKNTKVCSAQKLCFSLVWLCLLPKQPLFLLDGYGARPSWHSSGHGS